MDFEKLNQIIEEAVDNVLPDFSAEDKRVFLKKVKLEENFDFITYLPEAKNKLDKYYNDIANNLSEDIHYLFNLMMNGFSTNNRLIQFSEGILYIPKDKQNFPEIVFTERLNNSQFGSYFPEQNLIKIYFLGPNNSIDQQTVNLLKYQLPLTLIHELTHFYIDSSKKGAGLSIKKPNNQNNVLYINNKDEIESLTKEIENKLLYEIVNIYGSILSYLDVEKQASFIKDILKQRLYDFRTDSNSLFYGRLSLMKPENINKIYKDIYNYCINEYTSYLPTNVQLAKHHGEELKTFNPDLLNKWLKDKDAFNNLNKKVP